MSMQNETSTKILQSKDAKGITLTTETTAKTNTNTKVSHVSFKKAQLFQNVGLKIFIPVPSSRRKTFIIYA